MLLPAGRADCLVVVLGLSEELPELLRDELEERAELLPERVAPDLRDAADDSRWVVRAEPFLDWA